MGTRVNSSLSNECLLLLGSFLVFKVFSLGSPTGTFHYVLAEFYQALPDGSFSRRILNRLGDGDYNVLAQHNSTESSLLASDLVPLDQNSWHIISRAFQNAQHFWETLSQRSFFLHATQVLWERREDSTCQHLLKPWGNRILLQE